MAGSGGRGDAGLHNWGLDFGNFVAGCEGGERPKELPTRTAPPVAANLHCGARKRDEILDDIILDPRRIPSPPVWKIVVGDRRVLLEPDPEACAHLGVDPIRALDTVRRLGLNVPVLARLRHAAVAAILEGAPDDGLPSPAVVLGLDDRGELAEFWTSLRLTMGPPAEAWLAANPTFTV